MLMLNHTGKILKKAITVVFSLGLFAGGILFLPISLTAQNTQTIVYTVKDGLPSNALYRTTIDARGFLWIATEIGLSRFDGKKFRNYNTSDGLSDNEITDLFTDSKGVLWVMPFERPACFYNPTTDRFENNTTNKALALTEPSSWQHVLKWGGVAFSNYRKHFFIYKNDQVTKYENENFGLILKMIDYTPGCFLLFSHDSIRSFVDGKLRNLLPVNRTVLMCEVMNNDVYMATQNSILHFKFNSKGEVKLVNEKKYPFELRIFCKTGKRFAITSLNGTTYLLNSNNLEIAEIISAAEGIPVRNVLEDKDDNIWLSTIDKGLVKVQQKRISSFLNAELRQNFNAVLKNNQLFAGNNKGEIFKYDGIYVKKIQLNNDKNTDTWVRRMIQTKYGIYVATQSGSFLLNENDLAIKKSFTGRANLSTKDASLLNDSLLLMGNHTSAFLFNLNTNKVSDSIHKRVVTLGSDLKGNIYIGSNNGLFLWAGKKLTGLSSIRKGLSYKITALTCSPDNLMWIGLGADSLILIKENKWVASIPLGDIIPGNVCKALYCNKQGEVWLGTNKGLNRINYTYSNNQFAYSNAYFGVADGLTGEQVNDITIRDNIVYAATNEGISYLPLNIQLPVSDIATYISGIAINNSAAALKDNYLLKYFENDITINFSGVDLTGFIPLFEYSINDGAWQRTEKIELRELAAGKYKINVRALRRDGKPSIKEASVNFIINEAFWQSNIFWILVAVVILTSLLHLQQRANKLKQKKELEKILTEKRITELEMQALKAQINPHFIFNCLNSIKGFVYDKNYLEADRYLDKFAELMRTTIDNSDASIISLRDEIHYLDNYLQLEKLRFEDKFYYNITVIDQLDKDAVYVPAMLLQPYVENAIRHGMRYLENKNGLINITVKKEDNFMVCSIGDNGIGRQKAAELKSKMNIEYQSKGMSISKRRSVLYHIEQIIIDKKDDMGNPTGTTIIVKIPLDLKP